MIELLPSAVNCTRLATWWGSQASTCCCAHQHQNHCAILKSYKYSNFNVYITNLQISSNLLQQIVWHFNVYIGPPETMRNYKNYKFTKCWIPQIVWNCNVYIHPPEPLRNLQIQKIVFHKLFEILKLGKGFILSHAGGR